MSRQTLIPISAEAESSFDSFYPGQNSALLKDLDELVRGIRGRPILYMWGESGSGKTHLLNACCQLAQELNRPHIFLSLDGLSDHPSRFHEIEPQSLICVDDLHTASESVVWQTALFELYEAAVSQAGGMVISADRAIVSLDLGLKDLESRLAGGGVYKIIGLSEDHKLAALRLRALHKGFELNDQVLNFIVRHYARDNKSLFALLDRIDNASLLEQRKITVPFVKSLL